MKEVCLVVMIVQHKIWDGCIILIINSWNNNIVFTFLLCEVYVNLHTGIY